MANRTKFREIAPRLKRDLMRDFGLSSEEASAIIGNAGHESGGMATMQEISPTVKGSRGGLGYFQWTGPRRREFEAYLAENDLTADSYEGNYGNLKRELQGAFSGALRAVKNAVGLNNKVKAFEQNYEWAGIKHYSNRLNWAKQALGIDTDLSSDEVNAVKAVQRTLADKGLYTGSIDGDYGPLTKSAVKEAQAAINARIGAINALNGTNLKTIAVDGKWGRGTSSAAIKSGFATPQEVSLEARDEAAAARQAALQGSAARYNAVKAQQAAQPAFSAPRRVLTAPVSPGGTPVMGNPAGINMASRTRMPVDARMAANGLTPEAIQNSVSANALRAQQAREAAAKAIAAQAATAAARSAQSAPQGTVVGNPAGINMADRRRFTPNQMLDAVETAAARRAIANAPIPRPRPAIQPLTQRTVSQPSTTSQANVAMRPSGPSVSDMVRSAGAAKAAAASLAKQATAPAVRSPGASLGGYNPNASASMGRANALASRTITTPRVASVSSTPRPTTDVPASMRAGYPTKPSGSQLGGYNPAAIASVGRVSVRAPAPVAVSKPAPVPARTFTAPQVAAASAQPAAGPLAGAAARYNGTLAAQAAKAAVPVAPKPAPIPIPRMSPVPPAPVAPPPQPTFFPKVPLPAKIIAGALIPGAPLAMAGMGILNRAMLGFPNAGAKMGVSNVTHSGTTPQGLDWSRGTNRYGQKTMSYTDSRGVTHNTTTIRGKDYYSRGAASSGGGSSSSGSSRSSGSSGGSTSSGSSGHNPSGVRGGRGKKPGQDR